MKTFLLFILFTSLASVCFSQFENIHKRKPWEEIEKKFAQKMQLKSLEELTPETPAISPAQVKGVIKIEITKMYVGKMKNGDDLFAASIDNMPVISPTKTALYTMPVLGYNQKEKPIEPAR